MAMVLSGMIACVCLAIVPLFILILKMYKNDPGKRYTVFEFMPDHKLIVWTGVPVTYDISDIDYVSFSMFSQRGNYSGVFRIVKLGGKKSRPFMFDYSAYTKKTVWKSTEQNIQQVTAQLVSELRSKNISCIVK